MNTKISIGALVATTLVFGVLAFKAPSVVTVPDKSLGNASPVVNVPAPVVNVQVPEQKAPVVNVNVPKQSPMVLGSLAGPDIQSTYLSVSGIRREYRRTTSLTQGTTTICALQAPSATSTLVSGSLLLSVSSTTASIVTIAKSATAYATTTLLGGQVSIQANSPVDIVASSTGSTGIFGPNQWLVVGMQGGKYTSAPFSPTGVCQATFEVME